MANKANKHNKLLSRKGETFIEILIAVLIAAFGCVLVGVLYSAAMNINLDAREKDEQFYQAISDLETQAGSYAEKNDHMTWDGVSHGVHLYEQDGIYFYREG